MTGLRILVRKVRSPRDLARDERGAIGLMVAVLGVSLLMATGLALDVGLYYSGKRDLQVATEAAALSAALKPSDAQNRAATYLTRNGYDASVIKSVEVGYYCADVINHAAGSRFVAAADRGNCPGSSVQNAVRLTTGKPSRQFLLSVMGDAGPIPDLAATASAARIDEAGVAVTSGLLTITNSLVDSVNNLLGALINVKLRLDSSDVEALMGGNVDAGLFFDSLARRAGRTGTYQQMLDQGTFGIGDIADAAADAAYDARTATALRNRIAVAGNAYQVNLSGLFGLGVWKNMPVGSAKSEPGLRAGLNAYQLISYAAQSGPGVIDASNVVSLLVPGSKVVIKGVSTGLMDRPRFAFGPAGETTAGTSLLRLQVDVQLLDVLGLVTTGVPLVVDVAAARADVSKIECNNTGEQRSQTKVTLSAQSGLVNVYLGTLTKANGMTKPVPPLTKDDFAYAPILNVAGLVRLNAKAVVTPVIGTGTPKDMTFLPVGSAAVATANGLKRPIYFGEGQVVGNKLQVGTTIQGLSRDLQVQACVLICLSADTSQVASVLNVVTLVGGVLGSTTDPLLDNILAALGIELGHATAWVNGARCGVPVLI